MWIFLTRNQTRRDARCSFVVEKEREDRGFATRERGKKRKKRLGRVERQGGQQEEDDEREKESKDPNTPLETYGRTGRPIFNYG